MEKYGSFFAILYYAQFPYPKHLSDPYVSLINKLADSWHEFGGIDSIYSKTSCQILYVFYCRFNLLEKYFKTHTVNIELTNANPNDLFRHIFISFSDAADSLIDVDND